MMDLVSLVLVYTKLITLFFNLKFQILHNRIIYLIVHYLGINDSIAFHEGKLELEGDENVLADVSLNPKYLIVEHWHNVWREFNLGPRIAEGVIEVFIIII
jgi:hypothetical protein